MINSSTILPENLRHQYLLCYIKHYLENSNQDRITSNDIAYSIDEDMKIFSNQAITRLFSRYNLKNKPSCKYNPDGTKTFYRYYLKKKLLNVLQQLDIYSFNREQLIKALNSKSATKVTNSSIYSSDSAISGTLNGGGVNGVHNGSIHLLSPVDYLLETYSEEDIEYYNKITDYNFYYYYYFVQALKGIVEIDGSHLLIPERFPSDRDGYPLLTQSLLNYLKLPIDIKLFDTDRISRIVTQVYNPLLRYEDSNGTLLHGHHIRCKEHYNCISPMHLTPAETDLHAKYHNMARDGHPLLNPNEHFQVVGDVPTINTTVTIN
jgi:hypothetical protein